MTTKEHVYAIRNILSHGPSTDEFSFSDRLILHFLNVARAMLIEQKKFLVSEQSYQSLCLDLTLSSFHNCCEGPNPSCLILKSIDPLPKLLNSRYYSNIKVMDLEGRILPKVSLTQQRFSEYAITPFLIGWDIHDNHLYVIGDKHLTKVLLNTLFSDPEQITNLNCPPSSESCPKYLETEFPVDTDLVNSMYKLTLELLFAGTKQPIDTENNNKDASVVQAIQ